MIAVSNVFNVSLVYFTIYFTVEAKEKGRAKTLPLNKNKRHLNDSSAFLILFNN